MDFQDCHSYLLRRLEGGAEPDSESWARILEEITDTLPARILNRFDPEQGEGRRGHKLVQASRKNRRGRATLRPFSRDLFLLGLCMEQVIADFAFAIRSQMITFALV